MHFLWRSNAIAELTGKRLQLGASLQMLTLSVSPFQIEDADDVDFMTDVFLGSVRFTKMLDVVIDGFLAREGDFYFASWASHSLCGSAVCSCVMGSF